MNFSSKITALTFGVCLFAIMPARAAADQILKPFKLVAAAALGAGTGYVFADVVADQEKKELTFGSAAIVAVAVSALFYLRSDVVNNQLGKEFWAASTLSAVMVFLMRHNANQNKQKNTQVKCVRDEECSAW